MSEKVLTSLDFFQKTMIPPINAQDFSANDLEKLILIFNTSVPYFYLSYFHVLNEKSADWLSEFDNDFRFIFIEPKIDSVCGNILGKNLLGREMEYVSSFKESDFNDFIARTAGMVQLIDTAIKGVKHFNDALEYASFYANLMYRIFHRLVSKKFTKIESEFRILYQIPTRIKEKSEFIPDEQRTFTITINDTCKYVGKIKYFRDENNIKHIDMPLVTDNILAARQHTSLIDEIQNGNTYRVESAFKDVNLESIVSDYGYIGNKNDCLTFINRKLV